MILAEFVWGIDDVMTGIILVVFFIVLCIAGISDWWDKRC